MVKLFHKQEIKLSKKNTAKSIAREVSKILSTFNVEKDDIGLIVHSGVYKINFRAEPAFASNIQNHMDLGDNSVSAVSNHAFSFDIVDGSCGPHHAIQAIHDIFDLFNSKYAMLIVSDERPNRSHIGGNFETGFVMLFSSDGKIELINSEFSEDYSFSSTSHAVFDGHDHIELTTGDNVSIASESSANTFCAGSEVSCAEHLTEFFEWCRGKSGVFQHIIQDKTGRTSKLTWRLIGE